MSEIAVFLFGSVIFIVTAWATFAFGLSRMQEIRLDDLKGDSSRFEIIVEQGLTQRYVSDESPAADTLRNVARPNGRAFTETPVVPAAEARTPQLAELAIR